jgi:hypothetical protein
MWQRYLFLLTFAWWMGGLTFYALIVIPTATHVLGNHRDVGFITQQVTRWLNVSGIIALLVALWNIASVRPLASRRMRHLLLGTWLVMAAAHAGLFISHSWLSKILDADHHHILDLNLFEFRHGVYETFVTIQWLAALLLAWLLLRFWIANDHVPIPSATTQD